MTTKIKNIRKSLLKRLMPLLYHCRKPSTEIVQLLTSRWISCNCQRVKRTNQYRSWSIATKVHYQTSHFKTWSTKRMRRSPNKCKFVTWNPFNKTLSKVWINHHSGKKVLKSRALLVSITSILPNSNFKRSRQRALKVFNRMQETTKFWRLP